MQRFRYLLAVLLAFALVAAACGDDDDDEPGATDTTSAGSEIPDGPTITIGAQDFGESAILAQVYGQALEAAGYEVSYQS
ncbi:MAG TPA: glycine betaine ABC transporter substrate-binding protein, partial [Acidimicrobiia bacterium]|nr:glycine betaine ABC transporter substrate-binding protein [Acidimicrobiia bacterium]